MPLVQGHGPEAAISRRFEASSALYLRSPGRLDGVAEVAAPLTVQENFAPGAYRFVAG